MRGQCAQKNGGWWHLKISQVPLSQKHFSVKKNNRYPILSESVAPDRGICAVSSIAYSGVSVGDRGLTVLTEEARSVACTGAPYYG